MTILNYQLKPGKCAPWAKASDVAAHQESWRNAKCQASARALGRAKRKLTERGDTSLSLRPLVPICVATSKTSQSALEQAVSLKRCRIRVRIWQALQVDQDLRRFVPASSHAHRDSPCARRRRAP